MSMVDAIMMSLQAGVMVEDLGTAAMRTAHWTRLASGDCRSCSGGRSGFAKVDNTRTAMPEVIRMLLVVVTILYRIGARIYF